MAVISIIYDREQAAIAPIVRVKTGLSSNVHQLQTAMFNVPLVPSYSKAGSALFSGLEYAKQLDWHPQKKRFIIVITGRALALEPKKCDDFIR